MISQLGRHLPAVSAGERASISTKATVSTFFWGERLALDRQPSSLGGRERHPGAAGLSSEALLEDVDLLLQVLDPASHLFVDRVREHRDDKLQGHGEHRSAATMPADRDDVQAVARSTLRENRITAGRVSGQYGLMMGSMRRLRVQVWSDIVCPWCYVGKRRLEAAIARMSEPTDIEIIWRAFELDPGAPRLQPPQTSYVERLARKYGTSIAQADAMIERMTSVAAADGLTFRFDRIKPGNTFDAHRILHLAGERGVQDAVKERLLRAYMTEGEPIGDPEALARLRVAQAQRLLQDAGLSVERAAELAGFGSARDLRRAWRRHVGGTPSGRA